MDLIDAALSCARLRLQRAPKECRILASDEEYKPILEENIPERLDNVKKAIFLVHVHGSAFSREFAWKLFGVQGAW